MNFENEGYIPEIDPSWVEINERRAPVSRITTPPPPPPPKPAEPSKNE